MDVRIPVEAIFDIEEKAHSSTSGIS